AVPSVPLTSVWARAGNDVFAVGKNGLALHGDDAGFSVESTGTAESLQSVRGAGTDVWAVGTGKTALHRVDGGWQPVALPGPVVDLHSVMVVSPTDIWVAGDQGALLHYDGAGWRAVNSGTDARLNRIWGNSSNALWIA